MLFNKLRPNCLLTRYPIIFLVSPQFIRINNYQDRIKNHLIQHGYMVERISIPRTHELNSHWFNHLKTRFKKVHVFFAKDCEHFVDYVQACDDELFVSMTPLTNMPLNDYLNIAISLAEIDLQCSE